MKNLLLLFGLLVTGISIGQTITIDDTLYTGVTMDYYVGDSNAVNYDAVTGVGASWDYSNLAGYNFGTNTNSVIDASASTFAADFPNSDYSEDFQNGIKTFFRNDPANNQLIVDGFVFQESSNDFIIQYNVDSLTGLQFPVNQGDSYTDNIEGNAFVVGNNIALTGMATVTADGSGTLLLPMGNSYSNVLRVKTVEITNGTTPPPLSQPMTVTRTVYAYYDIANFQLPIFIHGTIEADIGALGTFGYTSVYSKDPLAGYVSIEDQKEEDLPLSIYPNPATNDISVNVPANSDQLIIYNALGQIELKILNPDTKESVDVSKLAKGVYFVEVRKGVSTRTQKLVIK